VDEIRRFYDEHAEYEWNRLARHPMEYAVTMRALADHLPPAPASVLDVGGGPGRYAIALTQLGYRVTLADISAVELDLAREQARAAGVELASIVQIQGRDLAGFPDSAFDAVLMMGPLYHLQEASAREGMVREGRRVLRPGGVLAATFIMRYALLRGLVKYSPEIILEYRDVVWKALSDGQAIGPGPRRAFTDSYFAYPDEVRPLMEGAGLETLAMVGVEGITSHIDERVSQLEGEAFDAWVDLNYHVGRHPWLYSASEHLLWAGRRR
jgi:S-adenosylmethionine-dependent methyltransferase